jgi:hypothetical protein
MASATQDRPAASGPAAEQPKAAQGIGTLPLPSGSSGEGDALKAAAAAPVMVRSSVWTRTRAWLRLAYSDLGSKEHQALLEWVIWAVIVSVVITVLQHDHALDAQYHQAFVVVEVIIFCAFAADYGLNLYYAPSRRGYALSFAGIVDLLAILPSLLLFVDMSSVKFLRSLRFLRFLRILQVVKAVQHRQQVQGNDEENPSLLLDLQLGVIAISAALLLVPDDALRNMLLVFTLTGAITTGIRRWLTFKQKPAMSISVLLGVVIAATFYTFQLDASGHVAWATWFLVGTVLAAAVTWFQIEAPAGI